VRAVLPEQTFAQIAQLQPRAVTCSYTGAELGRGNAASSVSALRFNFEWSGTAESRPSRARIEPMRPSVWRKPRRRTACNVRAVVIASAEVRGCPARIVPGSVFQATIAASALNGTTRTSVNMDGQLGAAIPHQQGTELNSVQHGRKPGVDIRYHL